VAAMDVVTPPPGITIRSARPSDLRLLAAIEDAGVPMFTEHFGAAIAPVLLSPAPSGLDRDLAPGFIVVADAAGLVVGFAHVTDQDGHAHLEQLSVLPEHGRRGIGSALVRAAMEEARWAGYDALSLCTYRDVPWNGPFYAGLGFAEVEQLSAHQQRLHDHEIALGLDVNGVRVVMSRALERQVTGG
jgi:ribosomal protein S18 acetylase RimI-like enzyme